MGRECWRDAVRVSSAEFDGHTWMTAHDSELCSIYHFGAEP